MIFGLSDQTVQRIRAVFAAFPQIETAIIYGSRAKGTARNGSDIDLTLVGQDDLTFHVLCRIMEQLDDLLLPYKIDLSIFLDISDSEVVDHIRRVGVEFYTKSAPETSPVRNQIPVR